MNTKVPQRNPADPFSSERNWPFVLREKQMRSCSDFLEEKTDSLPSLLRLFGKSGCGKSFFARELLARYGKSSKDSVTLYIDVYSADLEASRFFEKFAIFLGKPSAADRASPVQVPRGIHNAWRMRNKLPNDWRASYLYRVIRDLIGQIPFAGPFVKAVMPASIALDGLLDTSPESAFRYLLKVSKNTTVILAIDNVQFLSEAMRNQIEIELPTTGKNLKLVLIERLDDNEPFNWRPEIEFGQLKEINFGAVAKTEVRELVTKIMGENDNSDTLSDAIYRRSNGNLKSIWFQLKLAAQRHSGDSQKHLPTTYEEVISSLNQSDQAVLRLLVFLLGGLTVSQLGQLFQASSMGIDNPTIIRAVTDLTALGLLVINGDSNDRVKIEHELVSRIVSETTPEEEKLELRRELVLALDSVLNGLSSATFDASLYDRLLGVADPLDVKQSPSIQSHIVRFLTQQNDQENFTYLSTLLRDSVCWEVLDILPSHTIRILLNSIQKCSMFSFGLIAAEKLKASITNKELAYLYEAKFLVQLYRYEDANESLKNVPSSAERRLVQHNMLLGQCLEDEAKDVTEEVFSGLGKYNYSEFDAVILRNSGHLFPPEEARTIVGASVEAFKQMGSKFGIATALNNLGIFEIDAGNFQEAQKVLRNSLQILHEMGSSEAYQPHVNLSAAALSSDDYAEAHKHLSKASDLLPKGLLMDNLMIEFNLLTLRLLENNNLDNQAFRQIKELHSLSRKTSDLRFIDTLGHFVSELEMVFETATSNDYSKSVMEKVLDPTLSGIELYFDIQCTKHIIKIPYFLSPHWRY